MGIQTSCSSHKALFFVLWTALFATATFGQSLSIRKASDSYWIDASTPAEIPSTLQVSHDLRLWVDVQEVTPELVSVKINTDNDGDRFYRLMPSVAPSPDIRIMLLGDSMTADGYGWGAGLYDYFKPNATVLNFAQPAMAIKAFLQSAQYQSMLVIKPDYVFIQFGWVDVLTNVFPDASPPEEFKANLRTVIEVVRGFDGTPFLVTTHVSKWWFGEALFPYDQAYNDLIRQVSTEQNVQLLDLYQVSREVVSKLGRTGSAFMHMSPEPWDVHHVSLLGAKYYCRTFLRVWPESFGPYLTGIYDPPPPPPQP